MQTQTHVISEAATRKNEKYSCHERKKNIEVCVDDNYVTIRQHRNTLEILLRKFRTMK